MKTMETERLILRPFQFTDLDDFYEYCSQETVGPNAGWEVHMNKSHSQKIMEGFIARNDVLALYHKADKKVIGSVGLHYNKIEDLGDKLVYEIGYVLSTPYEGFGLMTEAVKQVMKYAYLDQKIDVLYVCHFLDNHKSQRVIEKCGFEYLRNIQYSTINFGMLESKLYSLTRDKYLNLEGNL